VPCIGSEGGIFSLFLFLGLLVLKGRWLWLWLWLVVLVACYAMVAGSFGSMVM
jgi:hypothetical protein